jgi:NitT/TauT family transport system substrate-binding protein
LKKIIVGILSILMCLAFIAGCSNESIKEEVNDQKEVKVFMPDGLPAVYITKMVKEKDLIKEGYSVNYSIEKTPDTISTTVMKQEADIAIVPSNMSAIAYNKAGNYKIAGTTGLGSFYLVSTEDIKELKDLKGMEVANTGKGLTPDITTKYILKEYGINESDINFTYANSANELVPMVLSGKMNTAIVPEPALRALISRKPDIKVIKSLNEEYKNITKSKFGYPQATIIVKSDFAKNNKEFIEVFLRSIDESIKFANENPKEVGEISQEIGLSTKKEMISKSTIYRHRRFNKRLPKLL